MMTSPLRLMVLKKQLIPVSKEPDAVLVRTQAKIYAISINMGLVNQTRLVTAVSELLRNMVKYGGGGQVLLEVVNRGRDSGVRATFSDKGPGIADIKLAMKDGFTTDHSLGIGLPGSKRLVNEFDIKSEPGKGTTVTILKWANG